MIFWEIRKSVGGILILAAVVLCGFWFWVCRSFFIGNYEDINGEIYKSYITELSALSRGEQREYIADEGVRIELILSSYEEKTLKYLHGEVSEEDYLKYIESYDDCRAKKSTFEFIEARSERIIETDELRFIYDLELEGYLTTMTADFPLIILLSIVGCGVFISDIPTEPFIKTCKNGRNKIFVSKLAATLIIDAILIITFNFAELAALFSKNLGDLSAPAASMDRYAVLDTDISCLELIIKTFLFRIIGEFTVCMTFFALSGLCANYIAFFCSAAAVVIIPAFFVNILPSAVRGIIVYYSLSGGSVLIDKNGLAVILWSVVLIAGQFVMVRKHRRF